MNAITMASGGRARPRKKALAVRSIALARRSSAFSRSSCRIRAASAVVVPGRCPASTCACFTQPRSVSVLIPSCSPTRRHAAVTLPASSAMSTTRRTARSRISSGYFLGAGMTPPFRGFGVSPKPGAIQSRAHHPVETWMGPETGEACSRLPETRVLGRCLKVFSSLPASDVHELEIGAWRDRLVQHGINIAGLGGEVVPCLLPGGNELFGLIAGNLERVDQY